jgi:hypothetical protein
MLERIREPRSPPVPAPPAAALRAGADDLSELDELSSSRRNCSLFMTADGCSGTVVNFKMEKGPAWRIRPSRYRRVRGMSVRP